MKLSAAISRVRSDIKHFGLFRMAYDVFFLGINACLYFKILKAMKIESPHPDYLESEERFRWQFFDQDQLLEIAKNPENKLTEEFVHAALEHGDECYGAVDGETVAAYGWYSNKPTELDGLTLHFDPQYVYMYRGFTHPTYRGKRLHAIGMNRALREYVERGYKGLISYVESNNFSSLQSVYRMGYQDIGRVAVLKFGSYPLMHASRGCRAHGFYLTKRESAAPAEPVLSA